MSKSFREAPLFLGLFSAQILIGAAVVLIPGNLFRLIINTQVLEGVVTPVTLVFVLILANRRALLGAAANGRLARSVGLVTVVVGGHVRHVPGGGDRARVARDLLCGRRPGARWRRSCAVRRGFARSAWPGEYLSSMCPPAPASMPSLGFRRTRSRVPTVRHPSPSASLPAPRSRADSASPSSSTAGNPRCGGQGVYTRHLTRELVALGPLRRGLRRPALARGRRGRGLHPGPGPRPLPRPGPVPGAPPGRVPRLVSDVGGRPRVRGHVHGRVPRAVGLQSAGSAHARRPSPRVRPGARQPVPRPRHRRDDGGRLARRRPPSTTRSPSTASSPSATPPTRGSSSASGAGSASCGCR